jgi:hypothetical protein
MTEYVKVRFTSARYGSTAGLIVEKTKLYGMSISDVSRLFPISEATKMIKLQQSKPYQTWEDAFAHSFDAE